MYIQNERPLTATTQALGKESDPPPITLNFSPIDLLPVMKLDKLLTR